MREIDLSTLLFLFSQVLLAAIALIPKQQLSHADVTISIAVQINPSLPACRISMPQRKILLVKK
jgi:hypothetical protein